MKRMQILIGMLVCAVWLGPAASQAEVINRIVATVDGAPITSYEMQGFREVAGASPMAPAGGAAGMSDGDVLDALIMQKLIRKEVEKQGMKAKKADIDGYIARIQAQSNLNDEEFEAALVEQGMTMEAYRERVATEVEQAMLMSREIGSRVNVTPEDVQRYYDEHIDEYTQPAQVRVRHIFRPLAPSASESEEQGTVALVHQVRQRALGGENFGNLASEYSLGPGADSGGDLGYFERGQMPEGIEQVAFSLENGDISHLSGPIPGCICSRSRTNGTPVCNPWRPSPRRSKTSCITRRCAIAMRAGLMRISASATTSTTSSKRRKILARVSRRRVAF